MKTVGEKHGVGEEPLGFSFVIGLVKGSFRFSIASYGKIWTNFLTNPILCGSTHLPPSLTGKSERQEVQKDLTWLIHLWAGFGPPQVCQMFKRWILLWVLLNHPHIQSWTVLGYSALNMENGFFILMANAPSSSLMCV